MTGKIRCYRKYYSTAGEMGPPREECFACNAEDESCGIYRHLLECEKTGGSDIDMDGYPIEAPANSLYADSSSPSSRE